MKTPTACLIVLMTLFQSSLGSVSGNQIFKRSSSESLQSFLLTIPAAPRSELLSLTRPQTPGNQLTSLESNEEWKKDCIDTQNYYRNLYEDNKGNKLKMLKWNASLAKSAQEWAKHLISENKPLSINPNYPYGANGYENTYLWRSKIVCSPGIDNYYKKNDLFKQRLSNWKKNPSQVFVFDGIQLFTQMMWPNTTHVGCASAQNAARKIEICHYYPG